MSHDFFVIFGILLQGLTEHRPADDIDTTDRQNLERIGNRVSKDGVRKRRTEVEVFSERGIKLLDRPKALTILDEGIGIAAIVFAADTRKGALPRMVKRRIAEKTFRLRVLDVRILVRNVIDLLWVEEVVLEVRQ